MPRNHRDVLESVISAGFVKHWQLPDLSGYSDRTVANALANLRKLGLADTFSGGWSATERGKIAFAIIVGKESRARRNVLMVAA
jgi:DeoR/GlpR family transcriptional regulator of sugar metabolism